MIWSGSGIGQRTRTHAPLQVARRPLKHHGITQAGAMMPRMRTTVTLDPDTEAIVRRLMRERGLTFKAALNEAIRAAARAGQPAPIVQTPAFDLGEPRLPIDKALRLAADLEDEELIRKLAVRNRGGTADAAGLFRR